MSRTVYFVPHTHWDREWHQPFELFRWRLVHMVDELLAFMDREPGYHFRLDGQSIVIEDYLALRPENEGRLREFIASGRIDIGPWWVQPDEFLPSGESHIRSFQIARVYSSAESDGDATVQVPAAGEGAGLTGLLERHTGVPDVTPDRWRFALRPRQIQTLRFGRSEP